MRFLKWILTVFILTLPYTAFAELRLGIVIGSNLAPSGKVALRYAHHDADKLKNVLVQLGKIEPNNIFSLYDPNPDKLRNALFKIRQQASSYKGITTVLFFYSGHADKENLLLGSNLFPLSEIKDFLKDTSANIRIAILDACQSGAISQTKGGKKVAGYEIQWTEEPSMKGTVLISSSTAEEASIESDDIGGSLFSHFFVSALRGAGDQNKDKKVSLQEAFRYAYHNTVERSSKTKSGLQHPTYDYKIAGQQELVLTWLEGRSASIVFGKDLAGTYLVFDRQSNEIVAEVVKKGADIRRLWLLPGSYYIKKRLSSSILLQKVTLLKTDTHQVYDSQMHTVPYEEDVTKGHHSPKFRPTWKYGAPPLIGTAYTLRRKEAIVGLFQATSYGVSDSVTLTTSLLGDLLFSPNVSARIKIYDGPVVWSLVPTVSVSFFDQISKMIDNDRGANTSTKTIGLGSLMTIPLHENFLLTWGVDWALISKPKKVPNLYTGEEQEFTSETQTIAGYLHLVILLGEHDLLLFSGGIEYPIAVPSIEGIVFDRNIKWGSAVLYAHAWEIFRLAVGVSFPALDTTNLGFEWPLPFFPFFELWWRW